MLLFYYFQGLTDWQSNNSKLGRDRFNLEEEITCVLWSYKEKTSPNVIIKKRAQEKQRVLKIQETASEKC